MISVSRQQIKNAGLNELDWLSAMAPVIPCSFCSIAYMLGLVTLVLFSFNQLCIELSFSLSFFYVNKEMQKESKPQYFREETCTLFITALMTGFGLIGSFLIIGTIQV